MTTWYSDHFGADGDNDTSLPVVPKQVSAGLKHGRIRGSIARFTGLPLLTAPDVIRLMTLKSSDRIRSIKVSCDGGSDAAAVNLGLYLTGANHDGAAVDADLFGSAVDLSSALDQSELFDEAALSGVDRGKQLWELVNVATASTYASDPQVDYDLCMVVTTAFTTADSEVVVEVEYTAGD